MDYRDILDILYKHGRCFQKMNPAYFDDSLTFDVAALYIYIFIM